VGTNPWVEEVDCESGMPSTLIKRRYKRKTGCGCKMCKAHKGHWADHRTRQDEKADIAYAQAMDEITRR
jgi:hypothetical protein